MNKDLLEILEAYARLGISSLKYTNKDFSLELGKEAIPASKENLVEARPVSFPDQDRELETKEEDLIQVLSPMVGLYYGKASPEKEPFVKEGDLVEEGQTLCLIEAMKMFNEIKSPAKGRVIRIHFNEEDLVAFEDVLIEIEAIC